MAHKTLIGGTAYEISGGKTLVGGTAYSIAGGKTLVGGTVYEVGFGSKLNVVYDFGSLTAASAFGSYRCTITYDNLPFDPSKCNAYMVNGVVYEAVCSELTSGGYYAQYLNASGTSSTSVTTSNPVAFVFRQTISTGTWTVWIYVLAAGEYDLKIGTV